MYTIHEIKHDSNFIVTAVIFTKALSENVSAKVMFELLPPVVDFIPYANLTKEIIVEWLENHSDMENLDFVLEKTGQQSSWTTDTLFPWS